MRRRGRCAYDPPMCASFSRPAVGLVVVPLVLAAAACAPAEDTTSAIVEALVGGKADKSEIAAAVKSASR